MFKPNHNPLVGASLEKKKLHIFRDLLKATPIGPLISAFELDPNEENLAKIASMVDDLLKTTGQSADFLRRLEEAALNENRLLKDLKDMMVSYRRPELLGQLSACSVLAAAVLQIKRLADQAEHMAGSLKGIDENIRSINARGDYFPTHVHSYVRMMIENHDLATVPHYFTVFNKSTEWYSKFADLQRSNPLGPSYLGHKNDLDELCAFLAEEVRPRVGPETVLHILMPTIGQLSLEEAVQLPESIHPCQINGQVGDAGTPFVFICMPNSVDKSCLHDIGLLKPREVWAMASGVGIPFVFGHMFETKFFIDPAFKVRTQVDLIFAGGDYEYWGPEPPRTLGEHVTRPWS